MVRGMVVIWGCTLYRWPFLPAGLITHWAYLNTGCLPTTHPPTASHTHVRAHTLDMSKTLWSEGLQAHRVVIHSQCASPLVPHQSLSAHVHHCRDIHTRPCQSCLAVWRSSSDLMCQVHEGWGSKESSFLISKAPPFPFPLKLSFARSIVLLKPHNYPSSLRIFFFTPLSAHARPGFYVFLQLHHFHSNTLVQSYTLLLLLPSPLLPFARQFFSAYLWSRCSFPSRSPTQRSPGFSLPAGPGIHHMKTPVQVVHIKSIFISMIHKHESWKELNS